MIIEMVKDVIRDATETKSNKRSMIKVNNNQQFTMTQG